MRTSTKPGKFGKVQMTNRYINTNLADKLTISLELNIPGSSDGQNIRSYVV